MLGCERLSVICTKNQLLQYLNKSFFYQYLETERLSSMFKQLNGSLNYDYLSLLILAIN